MARGWVLAGLVALPLVHGPAEALTFNFTQKAGDTLTSDQSSAFATAAAVWSAALTDNITVNVQIGFASLGSNVLGATLPSLVTASRGTVQAGLTADQKSAADGQAVSSFALGNSPNVAMTSAEAKAIGLTLPDSVTSDGTIEFSNSFTFSNQRDSSGGIAAGTYDLVGIAEHEIGHLLGFVSGLDFSSQFQTVLDQFRWSGLGTHSFTSGATAYFSYDSGATDVANFATGSGNQASHWVIGTNGVMVPEADAGKVQNITSLDLVALDVIGYDLAVPEPFSLALLAVGVLGSVGAIRRRA